MLPAALMTSGGNVVVSVAFIRGSTDVSSISLSIGSAAVRFDSKDLSMLSDSDHDSDDRRNFDAC